MSNISKIDGLINCNMTDFSLNISFYPLKGSDINCATYTISDAHISLFPATFHCKRKQNN